MTKTTPSIGGMQYEGNTLLMKQTAFGRLRIAGSAVVYEYYIKDHLGNNRVTFGDPNADGVADLLQEDHYYPFGLKMSDGTQTTSPPNTYRYNGKEYQDELGLAWYDYGARMYDPSIGRWNGVDALAEKYVGWSGYNYVLGNPVVFVDPDGRDVVNGYAKQYKDEAEKYKSTTKAFESGEISEKKFNRETKKFKILEEKYLHVEAAISTIKEVDPGLFNRINSLTVGGFEGGEKINIYVFKGDGNLGPSNEKASTSLDYFDEYGTLTDNETGVMAREPRIKDNRFSMYGVTYRSVGAVVELHGYAGAGSLANEFGDVEFATLYSEKAYEERRSGEVSAAAQSEEVYMSLESTKYSYRVQGEYKQVSEAYRKVNPQVKFDIRGNIIP